MSDQEPFCFTLMPFSDPYNFYYKTIYKPVIEEAGYKALRVDDITAPNVIIKDILNSIEHAHFILCDMSGQNPNVFYELGYAHAHQKDVILISHKKEDIPFDLRHIRAILYDENDRGWQNKLREDLRKFIDSIAIEEPKTPPLRSWWRMHVDQKEGIGLFIFNEIKKGRLRQGWGGEDDENIEVIQEKLGKGKKLNKRQSECWSGNRRLHQEELDGIQNGDLILLHNTPVRGKWVVVEVTGDYKYSVHPKYEDYGHIRKVRLLTETPLDARSLETSNELWRVVTTPARLIVLNQEKYDSDLRLLEKIVGL